MRRCSGTGWLHQDCGGPSRCGMECSAVAADNIGGYSVCTTVGRAAGIGVKVIDKRIHTWVSSLKCQVAVWSITVHSLFLLYAILMEFKDHILWKSWRNVTTYEEFLYTRSKLLCQACSHLSYLESPKTFNAEISLDAKIPIRTIASALKG